VWNYNLDAEMNAIASIVDRYPYVAMDTEFPGVVARPVGFFKSSTDRNYQSLRCNVNILKLIQVGLTFSDADGNLPDGISTWQFNFKFSLADDLYAPESIELLTKSGIRFQQLVRDGIEVEDFGELLISSGVVLSPHVRWLTFHAGYDFGYLLKLLTGRPLPTTEEKFFEDLHVFFPVIYDIKLLMKSTDTYKGGLDQLADELAVDRIGAAHQAGSDSLLTQATFFKLTQQCFRQDLEQGTFDEKFAGVLHALGRFRRPADVPFY
jgi:CCR4-NOT transcription complex subunit 7/8